MKSYIEFVKEELPTNNAGSGNVDGIGVGPKGEPGLKSSTLVSRLKRSKVKEPKKWSVLQSDSR